MLKYHTQYTHYTKMAEKILNNSKTYTIEAKIHNWRYLCYLIFVLGKM